MREKCVFIIAVILFSNSAQAKTASEVFESVSPSIVVVKTYDDKGGDKMLGSGVIFKTGVVATNCHVLKEAATTQVLHRGAKYPATLLHSDWDRDVCSLSVDGLKAPVVSMGSTSRLKVGEKVYAVGAPQGLDLTLSDGLISSLRQVEGGQYLQITAPISPGSSGGGLFDDKGQLIGLPTFYLADGQQLNFAVPVEWIKELPQRQTAVHGRAAQQVTEPPSNLPKSTDWLNKALLLAENQNWEGLKDHALHWIEAMPGNYNAWATLGSAYDKLGQAAQAIEAYQQAIRINPRSFETWTNLGCVYHKSGQADKAIDAYQQAIQISPEIDMIWFDLGSAYHKSSQTAKSLEAYLQAVRINPEYAEAWYSMGNVYSELGQADKAIVAFQQTIRINPEHNQAWFKLGNGYMQSNQTDNAIKAYKQDIQINPQSYEAWSNLGVAYLQIKQPDKSFEAYQRAVSINPAHAEAWYGLGIHYKIDNQSDKVMEVYKRLKTLDPAKADHFFNKVVLP
jgi:tetratricopeptide (TPR) repeat protein